MKEPKKIRSIEVDSLTSISLQTVLIKYTMRMKLLFTVSDLIENELQSKFTEFFDLACYALNQRVEPLYPGRKGLSRVRLLFQVWKGSHSIGHLEVPIHIKVDSEEPSNI